MSTNISCQAKTAECDKKWPTRAFPSEYVFICALRECMGLDPREDIFGQGSFKKGKGFKK